VGSQTSLASSAAGPPAAELRLCSSQGHWAWAIGKRREKVRKDRTQGVFLFCGWGLLFWGDKNVLQPNRGGLCNIIHSILRMLPNCSIHFT
jgi:hypothetical protein